MENVQLAKAQNDGSAPAPPKWMLYVGWGLSGLVILGMLASAAMKLSRNPQMIENLTKNLGYPTGTLLPIAVLELASVVLFAIPRTAIFGATLLTAYLGGAVATHVRVGENPAPAVIIGVLAWVALFLREPRLRALVPVRQPAR